MNGRVLPAGVTVRAVPLEDEREGLLIELDRGGEKLSIVLDEDDAMAIFVAGLEILIEIHQRGRRLVFPTIIAGGKQ